MYAKHLNSYFVDASGEQLSRNFDFLFLVTKIFFYQDENFGYLVEIFSTKLDKNFSNDYDMK